MLPVSPRRSRSRSDRMTQPARHRRHRHPARPSRRMGIAADAADLVATDAQRLPGAVVAARACGRIAPCFAAVLVVGGGRPDPAWRMRADSTIARDATLEVAARAAVR